MPTNSATTYASGFTDRYEDPVHSLPYDSGEGGYQWGRAGPDMAEDVIREEFDDLVPEAVIANVVDNLNGECFQWASKAHL